MGTTKDIREAVKAELRFDPLVGETSITVKNLNGDVALNGMVPAAWMGAGVSNVRDDLVITG